MHEPELPDEPLEPSRSQLRRDALEIFKLAETLAALGEAQLKHVPLADELRAEVLRTHAVASHIARKRQTQFLAKQLRKLDEDEIEPIRRALSRDRENAHRETAAMQRIETWRERLLDEGDGALGEFIALHPGADRQRLRQLVRNTHAERKANKPAHAYRDLFRELRGVLGEHAQS